MKKNVRRLVILSILLLLVAAALAGCASNTTETRQPEDDENAAVDQGEPMDDMETGGETQIFTPAELARFDGKDGNPAYVAVDGMVYDVTDSALWPEGEHTSCNLDAMAGRDLSEVLEQSPPRMRDLLQEFPVVGQLAAE